MWGPCQGRSLTLLSPFSPALLCPCHFLPCSLPRPLSPFLAPQSCSLPTPAACSDLHLPYLLVVHSSGQHRGGWSQQLPGALWLCISRRTEQQRAQHPSTDASGCPDHSLTGPHLSQHHSPSPFPVQGKDGAAKGSPGHRGALLGLGVHWTSALPHASQRPQMPLGFCSGAGMLFARLFYPSPWLSLGQGGCASV